MEWIDCNFAIDQREWPKQTVTGVACMGVGIHHEFDDKFTITHIPSGLRIMQVWCETMNEAKSYGSRVIDLSNWDFIGPDAVDPVYYDAAMDSLDRLVARSSSEPPTDA